MHCCHALLRAGTSFLPSFPAAGIQEQIPLFSRIQQVRSKRGVILFISINPPPFPEGFRPVPKCPCTHTLDRSHDNVLIESSNGLGWKGP